MSRSPMFQKFERIVRTAQYCERRGVPTREGIEELREMRRTGGLSRRHFLGLAGATAAGLGLGISGCADEPRSLGHAGGRLQLQDASVAVIGAGLAGLACADALAARGVDVTVYEAANRVGGRVYSMGGAFAGPVDWGSQVIERGGELIDTGHTTMRGYANALGLDVENVASEPGEVFYYFNGQHYSEAQVVDEYRAFVPAMRDDLRTLGEPTADDHTEADRALDLVNLREYLESRGAGPLLLPVIDVTYTIEYGREIDEQSCLNFLFFIHADRRSTWKPFGVFSDEKYHIVQGNQAVPEGLADRLPQPVELGRSVTRLKKLASGRYELSFASGPRAVHDLVVVTLPFSVLRTIQLDGSLGLPAWKRNAIDNFQYGTNAKLMVGFNGRPWMELGSNGSSYSDRAHLQTTWETNPSAASATAAVLTDYTGGALGASLNPNRTQQEVADFLADLNRVYPGSAARAARLSNGNVRAHLEHWPSNPLALGSYTCNAPGYFTSIAGNEGKPVGNLFFAGEHTDAFYEWQGFMEGAALSGLRAAGEVIDALR